MRAICVRRLWFSLASFSIISALWLGSDSLPTGERTSFSSLADSSGSRSSRRVPVMLLPDDELVDSTSPPPRVGGGLGWSEPTEIGLIIEPNPRWLLVAIFVGGTGRFTMYERMSRPSLVPAGNGRADLLLPCTLGASTCGAPVCSARPDPSSSRRCPLPAGVLVRSALGRGEVEGDCVEGW